MPLYEYRCLACGHQFELLILKSSEPPACPSCASDSLERILSMFAVSSDGTQLKNRQTLGAHQRRKAEAIQREKGHERHDHHDD